MRARRTVLLALVALVAVTFVPQEATPGLLKQSVVDQVSSCREPSGVAGRARERSTAHEQCDPDDGGAPASLPRSMLLLAVLLGLVGVDRGRRLVDRARRLVVPDERRGRVALLRGPPRLA
jgi:hypothetical protein